MARILVVYAGPGGITSSTAPTKYTNPVHLLGHEVVEHENGTVEVLVKWEYA